MPLGIPKEITDCRRFFLEPQHAKQRQYEALRRYFVDGCSSKEVAAEFGYTEGSFRVLCHHFRRDPEPAFFLTPTCGPQSQPKKSAARATIEHLRKRNHSVYEIAEALKEQGTALSATAVREVLRELGFAALPRRLDEERPDLPRPTVESAADARAFNLSPRRFPTRCGGLFLFLPDLMRLGLEQMADTARLPGSKMIPRTHALRACLALKLWAIERKSHVMALVADEGLGLFCGLNRIPKKSYLSEYSSRTTPKHTSALLGAWHTGVLGERCSPPNRSTSTSTPCPTTGREHRTTLCLRRAHLPGPGRRCPVGYADADLRKGEESEAVFRFLTFWKRTHGALPTHLVFDSRLTRTGPSRRDGRDLHHLAPSLTEDPRRDPRPPRLGLATRLDVPARKYRECGRRTSRAGAASSVTTSPPCS